MCIYIYIYKGLGFVFLIFKVLVWVLIQCKNTRGNKYPTQKHNWNSEYHNKGINNAINNSWTTWIQHDKRLKASHRNSETTRLKLHRQDSTPPVKMSRINSGEHTSYTKPLSPNVSNIYYQQKVRIINQHYRYCLPLLFARKPYFVVTEKHQSCCKKLKMYVITL